MGDNSITEADMAAETKIEPVRDRTPSSIESSQSPEPDLGGEPSQESTQPLKRKGGRKPIYATSEERKQRNRQAQAAFRERRTEYIKQLEATIKQNEDSLSALQQSQRSAADECLMLRYKNSLLERILLEKGIDVQAELSLKTGSPTLSFAHPAANLPQIPSSQAPLQRTAIQRHHARRSGHYLPRLAPGSSDSDTLFHKSPSGHPTPSSHASSPTSASINSPMVTQSSNTPPTSTTFAQSAQFQQYPRPTQHSPHTSMHAPQQMSPHAQRPVLPRQQLSNPSITSVQSPGIRQHHNGPLSGVGSGGNTGIGAPQYSDPFQKHIDQLEHEYDIQHTHSMLDQSDQDDIPGSAQDRMRGTYPPQFDQSRRSQEDYYNAQSGVHQGLHPHMEPTSHPHSSDTKFALINDILDPSDPMLDADPFGLSASMHYPTPYSFEPPPPQRPVP